MKQSYLKFKNKIMLEVFIKSLLISISLGLIAFSAPYIYTKIMKIIYNPLYFVLIGIGVFIVAFLLVFYILKPNNIKIARRIDHELGLNEKVVTMIEYLQVDTDMSKLQRENTLNILDKISVKKLTMRIGVFLIALILIACASTITSLALPKVEEVIINPGGDDPTYDADDWTIQALLNLIKEVEASDFDISLKDKYVSTLKQLVDDIDNASKQSEMETIVLGVIDYVQVELDRINTNNELYEVYRNNKNTLIRDLIFQIYSLDEEAVINNLDKFKVALLNSEGSAEETKKAIDGIYADYKLTNNVLNQEETLNKVFCEFFTKFGECSDGYEVGLLVDEIKPLISPIIITQTKNKTIAKYIEERLIEIFELDDSLDIEGSGTNNGEQDTKPQPKPFKPIGGGLGTGDVIFAGNDAFFDPDKGIVEYGDVIADYHGDILIKINEGKIDKELQDYLTNYFNALYGNDKNNEEE